MRSLRKNHHFTIRRTLVVNEPFGMHKCIPYANINLPTWDIPIASWISYHFFGTIATDWKTDTAPGTVSVLAF